jgi:hypothetical protein
MQAFDSGCCHAAMCEKYLNGRSRVVVREAPCGTVSKVVLLVVFAGRHAEQQAFYTQLYACIQEPEAALQALVQQKEDFARQACLSVLSEALQLQQS